MRVRYSRGADFSGTCYYANHRLFVNLGRHVRFPYRLGTHVAKSQSSRTHWWREVYRLEVADAYQLALFVYLHELYHHLVKAAQRNPRRKEAMCDRFAVRCLVEHYGCRVVDRQGRAIPRARWDFQDVDGFVALAPRVPEEDGATPLRAPTLIRAATPRPPRAIPVTILGVRTGTRRGTTSRGKKPTGGKSAAPRKNGAEHE